MNGILNVYKEPGFTSHDVVAKLRTRKRPGYCPSVWEMRRSCATF